MPTATERRQQELLEAFLEFLSARFSKELGSSPMARVVYGCIDNDEGKPGHYAIRVSTRLGDAFAGSVRQISDAQSGWIDEPASTDTSGPDWKDPARGIAVSDLWVVARDKSASVEHRMNSIHELIRADRKNAIAYVVGELAREDADQDWVTALVFLAEDIHFSADCQAVVKDALLRIARSFSRSTKAGAARVVWSAIRRASSFLEPTEANLLVPYLEREGVVDARAVALKCVERLFLPAPPPNAESVQSIGDRVYTLATKFLDPDIFGGGENALLAQSALCALAAIGDARLSEAIALANTLIMSPGRL